MAPNPRILPGYGGPLVAITAQATLNPGDSIDLPIDALRNNLGENVLLDTLRWTIDAQQQVESADPPTSPVGFPRGGAGDGRGGGPPGPGDPPAPPTAALRNTLGENVLLDTLR